jgi:Tfp pilus assembly protein PilV
MRSPHGSPTRSQRRTFAGLLCDRSGIALIESLICSAVVGIGVIGLAVMFARGQAVIAGEGDNRVAVYLAQLRTERARAQGFASLTAGTTTEQFNQALATVTSNAFYTRTTVVDCVDANDYSAVVDCATNPTAARRASVTVQSAPADARAVTLRAVLANR